MSKSKRFKISLPNGETLWLSGQTVSEAFIDGWQKYNDKTDSEKPCITVKSFIETVYKPTFFPTLKPKTKYNYERYLKLNIIPFLGDYPMNTVKVDTIQQFFNWMATAGERGRKKNLNKPSIERIRGLTSRIFRIAIEMGYLQDTPFKSTLLRIRAEEGGHHNALDDELIKAIEQNIPLLENEEE